MLCRYDCLWLFSRRQAKFLQGHINRSKWKGFFSLFGRNQLQRKWTKFARMVWANRYREIIISKKRERKWNGKKTVITFKIYLLENDCYANRRCILLFVIYEEFHLRKVKSGRPGLAFSIKRTPAVLELYTLELAWIGPYLYALWLKWSDFI